MDLAFQGTEHVYLHVLSHRHGRESALDKTLRAPIKGRFLDSPASPVAEVCNLQASLEGINPRQEVVVPAALICAISQTSECWWRVR